VELASPPPPRPLHDIPRCPQIAIARLGSAPFSLPLPRFRSLAVFVRRPGVFGTVRDGRRPKTIYEVSRVKSSCGGRERFFLPSFLSKSVGGTFEQVPAFMSATALFAWPRRAVKPQRPQGLRHQAQGLDGASARQQQLVIGLMASERILSTFVRLLSLMLEVEVPYFQFDPRLEPAF